MTAARPSAAACYRPTTASACPVTVTSRSTAVCCRATESPVSVGRWERMQGRTMRRSGTAMAVLGQRRQADCESQQWRQSAGVEHRHRGFLGNGQTLVFGSATANNQVELQNAIDLNGADRTIRVDAGTGGDSALLSGNIQNTPAGSPAGLIKTGAGILILRHQYLRRRHERRRGHADCGNQHRRARRFELDRRGGRDVDLRFVGGRGAGSFCGAPVWRPCPNREPWSCCVSLEVAAATACRRRNRRV